MSNNIEVPSGPNVITISYSLLQSFRNCRKLAQNQYVRGLEPHKKRSHALEFGTLIHKCLELWHTSYDLTSVMDYIENHYKKESDSGRRSEIVEDLVTAKAMMRGYSTQYPSETFKIISLESNFVAPIIDLDGTALAGVRMKGRVDGIVEEGGQYFLLENKTAGVIDKNYLNRLWIDAQIILYSHYISQTTPYKLAGVYYNVIAKTKTKMEFAEGEDEFELRKMIAASKNKSGKTSIQPKSGETELEYLAKLGETYSKPSMYVREKIYIPKSLSKTTIDETVDVVKSFLSCIKRGVFYKNTDHCFRYGTSCPYFDLCKSNESLHVEKSMYTKKERITLDMVSDVDIEFM